MNRWSTLALLAALTAGEAHSAPQEPIDPLSHVRFLVGRWTGTSEGQPGKGSVSRVYEPILNGRFIQERNRSEYPAQPSNPKGEVHEHWSFFSYDKMRRSIVLRQFHVEGFVTTYRQVASSGPDAPLVLESEHLENLPGDWKARETYERLSNDEFTETFELAGPGKPFEVYSKTRFKRTP